jgi:dTMP kinase
MGLKRGLFITIEGIEGSGKTTQIKRLRDFLQSVDATVISTREPGGTPVADRIRDVLLTSHSEKVSDKTELLLYLASRAQHVHSIVKPALYQGITVLCDRFFDATVAYQGYGRGLDIDFLQKLNRYATDGLNPDLTILLDLSAKIGLSRIRNDRKRNLDRLESESIEFHERVRRGYLQIAESEPQRFFVIDGTLEEEEIFRRIKAEVTKRFDVEENKIGRNTAEGDLP